MKEIKLSQEGKNRGKYITSVDDGDYEYLNQWRWQVLVTRQICYALRRLKDGTPILMHRQLLNPNKGLVVDHINRNGLDNQRNNLRICSYSQNLFNAIKTKGKSKYKGVHLCHSKQKYKSKKTGEEYLIRRHRFVAVIRVDHKQIHLGSFIDEISAAKAYNRASLKYHGEFANLNKI